MSFEFDQYVISNMTVAMQELCTRLEPERVNPQVRVLIADAMIASAKGGKYTLVELYAAGLNAVLKNEKPRSSWLGLRRSWRKMRARYGARLNIPTEPQLDNPDCPNPAQGMR